MFSSLASLLLVCAAALPAALAKPEQIRAVQSPIFHYYLQAYPQDPTIPVMGPEASSEYFNIAGTIQSANTSAFLNIGADSTSYKTLTFAGAGAGAGATDAWALEGDTIITSTGSSFGRQLNFLVCQLSGSQYWQVYLQTGSETPAGKTCSNYQSLHLPCLC
ncbi:MFS siderochrome iron transporter 1 [Hypoxylon texense]